jgi:nucleoside-diphosphate-sugar epimerase
VAIVNDHRPTKLLVTGAPGWLCDALLASLARDPMPALGSVRCLVKHPDGNDPRKRWGMDAEIVAGDLTDPASLQRAAQGVDTVLHAAAIIHVTRIEDYYRVNAMGTRNLARAAARAGARRFVYVSTNAAGGKSNAKEHLVREDTAAAPTSHYGRSKLLAERWLFDTEGAMERTVLRPCMFYGPPVPQRHVDVYKRIMTGRMPLVGGGGYARSLAHIDNLVQATRLALTRAQANGQVYYVADRRTYTTREVIEAMARALGVEPRFLPLPAVAADVAFVADTVLAMYGKYQQTLHLVGEANSNVGVSIDKARTELGYEPRVEIEEGMRGAVDWCRAQGLL